MSAPYIPHLTKPSGKDTVFLTLSGTRSSTPDDFYANVPTDAERVRRFFRCRAAADLQSRHRPADSPTATRAFQRHAQRDSCHRSLRSCQSISPQATALLQYFPEPNLAAGNSLNDYNYHLLTTAQSNTTKQASATTAASAPMPRNPAAAADSAAAEGAAACAESGPAPEHQPQLQLVALGLRPGNICSRSWAAKAPPTPTRCRPATRSAITTSPASSTPTGTAATATPSTSSPTLPTIPPALDGIDVPNDVPLNYGVPNISLSNGSRASAKPSPASPSRRPSRSPRS